jgi:NAD-dependent DNA ligase
MHEPLSAEGQPPRAYYRWRVDDRLVAELLGFCKGLICDGVVNDDEAMGLRRWLAGNPDAVVGYPGKQVAERLLQCFADGVIDEDERLDLEHFLLDLTGETAEHDQPMNLTTRDSFDNPCPTIFFDKKRYVFTGKMLYGTRAACEQAVQDRGGWTSKRVDRSTDYLIVGPIASAAWIQGTHGTKLRDAVGLKQEGCPLKIVREEDWVRFLHD